MLMRLTSGLYSIATNVVARLAAIPMLTTAHAAMALSPTVTPLIDPSGVPTPRSVINFTAMPSAATPFAISGVSFTGAGITLTSGIDVAPSGSPVFSVQSPTDAVTITFPQNVKAAGAYFIVSGASTNADLMVDVFDNVTLLGTHRLFDSTSATRTFFGASSTQPFNKLHFRNAALNGVSFLMDDVTYAFVPEPTTLIQVVALGALAPFVRGRRRSDSHPVA
jgi:hypothetical protein